MKHKITGRKLKRTSSHRKAMFYNMTKSLIKYESIKTTLPKANELRRYIEPLITLAKKDNLTSKRLIFKKIKDKNIIKKLFEITKKRYILRHGGYTRIYKYKYRNGDSAKMAIIELVEKFENTQS